LESESILKLGSNTIETNYTQKNIYLVAGFNKAYLKKSEPYLATMNQNSQVNNIIITLDFEINAWYKERFDSIRFIKIFSTQVKSPNSNACMQHGGFLEVLDFVKNEDVLIFTDTDIKIQRSFNGSDLEMLESCIDGDVFVGFNGEEDLTLLDDSMELDPNVTAEELLRKYPELSEFKSYNTGVIVANYKTYRQLYREYQRHWDEFSPFLGAYVKQQVLLSYLIQKYFHLRLLPYIMHSHANSSPIKKYSSKKRIGYIGDDDKVGFKLCIGGEIVVFNHHVKHKNELEINGLRKKTKRLYKIISSLFFLVFVMILVILSW
jgi:hypothetical protein